MKPAPHDWPRLSSALFYDDAPKAIEWLGRAFGFETRLVVEGGPGTVVHSELTYGESVVMVATAAGPLKKSPRSAGGANTQSLMLYVDDVDAHCARAREAGARIDTEPETKDYGEEWGTNRSYGALDPEGHYWWFTARLAGPAAGGAR
jgi:uncharacterized glyoxalase superfamily protein PhnB